MFERLEAIGQGDVEERVLASLNAFDSDDVPNDDTLKRCVTRAMALGRADLAAEIVDLKTDDKPPRPEFILERIIDESQLTGVAFFERGRRAAQAVGRVVIGSGGFGTGFMISPRLMMTNNHVIRTTQSAASSVIEFDFARDLAGRLLPRKTFRLQPNVFFRTNAAIDYTIVAVEPTNSQQIAVESRGWLHLIRKSGKAILGERLNIIQHPDGQPQMIALRENTLVGIEGFFLHYRTDTRPGSSGSPVLNDQFQVAALHHAGVPARNSSGQLLKKDGSVFRRGVDDPRDLRWVANEGARISEIVSSVHASNLSSTEQALFDAAFNEPPSENLAGDPVPGPLNHDGPGSQNPIGPGGVGPDGIARWNFQLTFGPTPTGSAAAPPAVPQPELPPPAVSTGSDPINVSDTRHSEDAAYYDAEDDAATAADYYSDIDPGTSPGKLFDALKKLLKKTHKHQFSYRKARHDFLYPVVDRHPSGKLESVYSGAVVSEAAIKHEIAMFEKVVADFAVSEGLEATDLAEEKLDDIDLMLESNGPFNCEHVVPQSWFQKKQPMKADLHHLFTCEPNCNSFRSNIPYFEFDDNDTESLKLKEVVQESIDDLTQEGFRPGCGLREGRKFEPEANKGAVARATLYFLLRYPGLVGDVKTGNKSELTKSRLDVLRTWCKEEPPTLWEKHRNAEISRAQGNRNPLIDHPEWIDQIDFEGGFG